jgi:hypothetical protein
VKNILASSVRCSAGCRKEALPQRSEKTAADPLATDKFNSGGIAKQASVALIHRPGPGVFIRTSPHRWLFSYFCACVKHLVRLACFLLIASAQLFFSKEVLHEIVCHEETRDFYCGNEEDYAVSPEHHHCECLQLSLPPFCHEFQKSICYSIPPATAMLQDYSSRHVPQDDTCIFFRGPPVS